MPTIDRRVVDGRGGRRVIALFSYRDRTNEFHFNRKELRVKAFRYFGYWNGSKDSASISIGSGFPE